VHVIPASNNSAENTPATYVMVTQLLKKRYELL